MHHMTIQELRAWLRRRLQDRVAQIQSDFVDRIPTSKELDDVLALRRLAQDTGNISAHVFLLFAKLMLIGDLRVRFEQNSVVYFREINENLPRDATDLVRHLIIGSLHYRSSASSRLVIDE